MPQFSPIMVRWAWWAPDGSAVYYLGQLRDLRTLTLHRLEPATGEVTTVLSETGTTRVEPNQWMNEPPIVRVLADEVLGYSQRDGWGHLYRYDLRTGELLGQLTSGQWAVRQILHVDEAERVVYFTASGLVHEDPYRRTVCRVGLDGSGFAKVTDDELDHIVTMPDTMEYFIDSASTVDTPPVTTVRDWSGRVLVELERADITKLTATGWTPPERFCVKAADGVTDIYGVLYRPRGFDPAQRYPVVDSVYPGSQVDRVAPCFHPGGMGSTRNPSRRWVSWWWRWMGEAPQGGASPPRRLLRPLGRRGLPGRPCRGAAAAGPDPAMDGPGPGGRVRPLRRRVRHSAGDAGLPRGVQGRSRPLRPARRPLLQPGLRGDLRRHGQSRDLGPCLQRGPHGIDCLVYVRKRCWDSLVRELMGTQPPAYRPAPSPSAPELLGELFA
jgi:hypothetical protein